MEGKFHSTSSLTGEPIGTFLFHMGLCLSPAARASIHCGSGSLVYLCLNPSKSQTRSAKLARKPAPYPKPQLCPSLISQPKILNTSE